MTRAAITPAPRTQGRTDSVVRDPRFAAAVAAVLVRATVASQTLARGVSSPQVDGAYYLDWAADIAHGDFLGRTGTLHGEAFFLNPLYPYVIAPIVAAAGRSPTAVVIFQTLLAGGTAALAAAAAKRFARRTAAWIAGLAVAFSAALVHLDGKVAVAGVAAFLAAGLTWSLSPETDDAAARRGHGPFASGLWLGASLLTRPVLVLALPFVMWLHARRTTRPVRTSARVLLPVLLCLALPYARNVLVAGEAIVLTSADGQNLHLGNNEAARRERAMASDLFDFGPQIMQEQGVYRVAAELHREPSRAEVSRWFAERAWSDLVREPAASLGWYGMKLCWFAAPNEFGSSDDLEADRANAPLLSLAFVPTWLLVAAAAASIVVARRTELLLGPGAVVSAHALACTLVFPLSNYRTPAIPALAVLTGCAAVGIVRAVRDGRVPHALAAAGLALATTIVGRLPEPIPIRPQALLAREATESALRGDLAEADDLASRSLAIDPDGTQALSVRLTVANTQSRFEDARAAAVRLAELRPWAPDARIDVAWCDARLGRGPEALRAMDRLVSEFPWSAKVRGWRGTVRAYLGDGVGAKEDFAFAQQRGFQPPAWALERAGL